MHQVKEVQANHLQGCLYWLEQSLSMQFARHCLTLSLSINHHKVVRVLMRLPDFSPGWEDVVCECDSPLLQQKIASFFKGEHGVVIEACLEICSEWTFSSIYPSLNVSVARNTLNCNLAQQMQTSGTFWLGSGLHRLKHLHDEQLQWAGVTI